MEGIWIIGTTHVSEESAADIERVIRAAKPQNVVVELLEADMQLHNFVSRNERRKQLGQALVPNLEEGIWHYSRHPNYFDEQLWWWGLVMLNLDCDWSFNSALINSLCLAYVIVLVEELMLKQEYMAEAYKKYQRTTSLWIPWFIVGKEKRT